MIVLGLIVFEIPAVVGKHPNRLTLFNHTLIVNITGNLMEGIL